VFEGAKRGHAGGIVVGQIGQALGRLRRIPILGLRTGQGELAARIGG
jgi:hypothetical protein